MIPQSHKRLLNDVVRRIGITKVVQDNAKKHRLILFEQQPERLLVRVPKAPDDLLFHVFRAKAAWVPHNRDKIQSVQFEAPPSFVSFSIRDLKAAAPDDLGLVVAGFEGST